MQWLKTISKYNKVGRIQPQEDDSVEGWRRGGRQPRFVGKWRAMAN
jgi:hypothetical protein